MGNTLFPLTGQTHSCHKLPFRKPPFMESLCGASGGGTRCSNTRGRIGFSFAFKLNPCQSWSVIGISRLSRIEDYTPNFSSQASAIRFLALSSDVFRELFFP